MLLLPIDIKVSEISAGGVVEEVAAWSEQATQHVYDVLGGESSPVPGELRVYQVPEEKRLILEQHIALYREVADNAYWATTVAGPAWRHKREKFDYSLGDGLRFLVDETHASGGLIVIGSDQISSGGRKAATAFAAVLGLGIPGGTTFLSAGLVDFESGDVLWQDFAASAGGTDLRKADDVASILTRLFASFPTRQPLSHAAAGAP